jgi:hypothetical protein
VIQAAREVTASLGQFSPIRESRDEQRTTTPDEMAIISGVLERSAPGHFDGARTSAWAMVAGARFEIHLTRSRVMEVDKDT